MVEIYVRERKKYAKTLMKSKNVSARAKQEFRELKDMLKKLNSMMENRVKWSKKILVATYLFILTLLLMCIS